MRLATRTYTQISAALAIYSAAVAAASIFDTMINEPAHGPSLLSKKEKGAHPLVYFMWRVHPMELGCRRF